MNLAKKNENTPFNSTGLAYVATRVLDTPFWAIYNMLPIILYKNLGFTPVQIAILVALKPIVSLLSYYWSAWVDRKRFRLLPNIIWGRLLGYLPFFLFPFMETPSFFIFAYGIYMMMAVGVVPAWMEVLKLNLPSPSYEKVVAYSQALAYIGGGLLPFILGGILDSNETAWRWLFPIAGLLGCSSVLLQMHIKIPSNNETTSPFESVSHQLKRPWSQSLKILKEDPAYLRFQIGFMLIGGGLMIIQPALPYFFIDTLKLSYTELAIALTLCKGIGFAIASPIWSKKLQQMNIFSLTATSAFLACLFPLCLLFAIGHIAWLYIAYIFYGVIQSGSELIWNLSGPHFSKDQESSAYSNVNIAAVGIRGCVIPAIGGIIVSSLGVFPLLFASSFLSLMGALRLSKSSKPIKDLKST